MGRTKHRDHASRTVQLPGFLLRVFSAVVNPVTGANDLAGELLQLAEARLVVLERISAGTQAVVAPNHLHPLLEHPAIAELLRQARELEAPRFYSTDEAIPGLSDIQSPEKQTNCLAVPLIDNGIRIGTAAVFGLARGELDKTTGNIEMLAPLLAMALRNVPMPSHPGKPKTPASRRSDLHFQELLLHLPVSVVLYDADGNILLVNDRMTSTFGYTRENVPHLSDFWSQAFPDPDARAKAQVRWSMALSEALRSGNPDVAPEEYLITCRDGTVRLTEAFGTWVGDSLLVVLNDISTRRQTEAELDARDISARLKVEDALRKSEAKFAAIFNLTPDPLALTRFQDGVILEVSNSFAKYFGYRSDEVIGKSTLADLGIWVDGEQRRQWKELIERDGEALGFEARMRRKDGIIMDVLVSGKLVEFAGEPSIIADVHDITEQKQQSARLEQIAHHDPLTGLPNRLLLGDRLQQAVARNRRDATIIAVCYIDLDGFKEINDRFGHHAGDQLLIDVANRLNACVRGGDTVVRLGGDEFVVLLSGLSGEEECRLALERLLQTVADPYVVGGNEQNGISASIGVTLFPNDQSDPDMLVRHADHAMYVAKQAGKNRYQLFDADLELRIEARHSTLRQLTDARKSDQFRLYYQPKVNCRQGRVVGVEALIRWQHPTLGLLSPAEFLPLIEDSDLAFSIGEWVIREALSQMSRWKNEGVDLHVSVNAFVRHLLQPGFPDMLAAALEQHPGVKAGDLQIEIVETAALKELDAIREAIEDCKELGVVFSLDDFGAGYSTLAYLRHLPAAEIKIDHSFVRHMLEREEDLAIVEAVIGMGRAFGRTLVAEGAETAAHIVRLLALGCDVMQGYALARPMAASEIPRWLREFRPDPAWHGPAGNSGKTPRDRG